MIVEGDAIQKFMEDYCADFDAGFLIEKTYVKQYKHWLGGIRAGAPVPHNSKSG